MATTVTSSQTNLVNPLIKAALEEGLKYQNDTFAEKMYTKEYIDQPGLVDTSISTSHFLIPLQEDEVPQGVGVVEGFQSYIPWQTLGLSRQITKVASLQKGGNELMNLVKSHGEDMVRSKDAYSLQPFRLAFDSSYTIADGQSLISTAHPLRSGGSYSNTFTDGIQRALTYETLLDAVSILNRQVDHSGNPVVSSSKFTILVPNEQRIVEQAFQLIGGDMSALKAGTQNNDQSYFRKYEGNMFNLIVSNSMTLNVARAIGETTNTYASNESSWVNRWFVIDEMRAKKYLAQAVLKGYENLTQSLLTESFSQKEIFTTSFGFGVRAGIANWVFGSRGDNAAL